MSSQLARARAHLNTIRRRSQEAEHMIVRKAVIAATAAGTGFAESKGMPVSVMGVPMKLALAAGGTLLQLVTRDPSIHRLVGAFSDAQMAAYMFEAGKQHAFIAGDENGGQV